MYAKCGALAKAQEVFDDLPFQDVDLWTALIVGYAQQGYCKEAMECFERMQLKGIPPNGATFSCILKACAHMGALEKGENIHAEVSLQGLIEDPGISNALVNMYAKCGELAKAQEVFDYMFVHNTISWSALIAGYVHKGYGKEAINCFDGMRLQGFSPDAITYACVLKACGITGALVKGQEIHAEISRRGVLRESCIVATALLDMYAKCGSLTKAEEVFNKLPAKDVICWNALIAGYMQHGQDERAMKCYEQMKYMGPSPDAVTFCCVLKACASLRAATKGQEIHGEIIREGLLERTFVVGNALVDMYAKCGTILKAQQVFDGLCVRDVVSWTALIVGYVDQGCVEMATNCFEFMQLEGFSPNAVTLAGMLKACFNLSSGQEIHTQIVCQGLETHNNLEILLVDMYAKCGALMEAKALFDELPFHDVISWTSLISGYTQYGNGTEAIRCFDRMLFEGVLPDPITYNCVLSACGSIRDVRKGEELHADILTKGVLKENVHVGTALVDMYAKCGSIQKAKEVFNELLIRDTTLWNAMTAGYTQYGYGEDAVNCFEQMQLEGFLPDSVTLACILKACGSLAAIYKGQQIHAKLVGGGWRLKENSILGTAVVDMYMKCGALVIAMRVFDELCVHDVFSWTVLMTGFAQHGHYEETIDLYEQMKLEGITPDALSCACILKACGTIGAACKGQDIHCRVATDGLIKTEDIIGYAIVDMYAKCGMLTRAQKVFDQISCQDVVSWNVLIAGYSLVGKVAIVLQLFNMLIGKGIQPDSATVTILLNSCSHLGMLQEAQAYFKVIDTIYDMNPNLEQLSSVIDLFGRAGCFDKAMTIIKGMPSSVNISVWHTVLGACQKWGNVHLGRMVFDLSVEMDEVDSAAYVSMCNIFIAAGMQDADDIVLGRV